MNIEIILSIGAHRQAYSHVWNQKTSLKNTSQKTKIPIKKTIQHGIFHALHMKKNSICEKKIVFNFHNENEHIMH